MPKAKRAAAAATDGDDRPIVKVDTDQRDTAKAVSRMQSREDDEGLPGQNEDDGEPTVEERFLNKSRSVAKRVTRIQRKYDQQLAEQEARHQREMRELRGEVDKLKTSRGGDGGNASEAQHEAEMKALEAQLTKAQEDGNSTEVARLTREISRKETAFWNARTQQAMGGGNNDRRERRDDDRGQDAGQTPQRRQPSRAGIAFTEANDWWDDPDYYVEKQAANAIFGRLVEEEGADPDDPATYRKVAKRLARKFPDLEIEVPGRSRNRGDDDDDDDDDEDDDIGMRDMPRRAAHAPVQHARNRDPDYRPSRRSGEQHLSQRDLQTMRDCGLDPDNEKHLLHFAQGKRETEESERSRR